MSRKPFNHDDFIWFHKNLSSLQEKYEDQFVGVKDRQVVCAYHDLEDAFQYCLERYPRFTFYVFYCPSRVKLPYQSSLAVKEK